MTMPKRVALYDRIFTAEKGQDPETQRQQLREYTQVRGWQIIAEYVDHTSGTTEERSQYKAMLDAARMRKIDVVLVWRYDRFAQSMQALVNALKEFQTLGVDFISYQENIDTTIPTGELVFHVMASLAQFESSLISQRVKAGMARAKAQGKHVARPPLPVALQNRILELRGQGLSISKISQQLGIAYGTIYYYARKFKR